MIILEHYFPICDVNIINYPRILSLPHPTIVIIADSEPYWIMKNDAFLYARLILYILQNLSTIFTTELYDDVVDHERNDTTNWNQRNDHP
jgi:hypothetical protein